MDNIDFLKEVLMSVSEYWIVSKENEATEYGEFKRIDDDIILISIPQNIRRGLKYEEITLQEIENLRDSYCDQNIFFTNDYPPFQTGQTFYHIYKGYPVEKDIKQFVINALPLKSCDLFDYKELIK